MKQSHFSANPSDGSETGHKSRLEFNWKKNTRFEEIDEDEMSSDGQVENKEYKSEHCPNFFQKDEAPRKRAFSF